MPVQLDAPSDPYEELTFKTAKHASLTTELHLGNRGITRLVNFEHFTTLDSLWINHNNLTSLRGLENNFRIRYLYAHNNRYEYVSVCIYSSYDVTPYKPYVIQNQTY